MNKNCKAIANFFFYLSKAFSYLILNSVNLYIPIEQNITKAVITSNISCFSVS